MKRFGENDALDCFAKDILKSNECLKRWSHINSQTTYVKKHKHVDFIPHNVNDHHQLIIYGCPIFFAMRKLFFKMMIKIGKWPSTMKGKFLWNLKHKLRLAIMFSKMIVVFLEEVHYGFLLLKCAYKWSLDTYIQMYINYEEDWIVDERCTMLKCYFYVSR